MVPPPHVIGVGSATINGTIPSTGGSVILTGNFNYTYPGGFSGTANYEIKGNVPSGGGATEFNGFANITVTQPDGSTKTENPSITFACDVPLTTGGVLAFAGASVQIF